MIHAEFAGHGGAQGIRQTQEDLPLRFGEDQEELLAPETEGEVAPAQPAPEEGRQLAQHGVSRVMAVGIVDPFEVVNVEKGKTQGARFPPGPQQLPTPISSR